MKKVSHNIERNRLDYLLTDTMPVEVSELFSYGKLYEYLLSRQPELDRIIMSMKQKKAANKCVPFTFEWGSWATAPLKFSILKGTNSSRELNLVQPLSALNMYFFIECYQKELLDCLADNSCFSLRYHRKNTDLYYRCKTKHISDYFEKTSRKIDRGIIQQTGMYFKIMKFNSVSSFTSSRLWQQCNFRYKNFAKLDFKSCFDSIYTHAFKWCVVRNTIDSKNMENANLFIAIDRILQNINGLSSNGLIIGPEFSRMMAELLLQHIDMQVKVELSKKNLKEVDDYRVFRYVDDIFVFANSPENIDEIAKTIERIAQKYLLKLNDLKFFKSDTPVILSSWLCKTRMLSDRIADLFNKKHDLHEKEGEKYLLKDGYISIDRLKFDFMSLVNEYPADRRYIVSFMLSTLLNNISNKKDGYRLFKPDKYGRAYVLLDLALYIYSFCPCFEHTQKLISMIVYMNEEVDFVRNEENHKKLQNQIRRYSFIFEKGNLNDLVNWFVFFYEYKISLPKTTEQIIVSKLYLNNDPILWANYLIYTQYFPEYHAEISQEIDKIILSNLDNLCENDIMMQREFWYVLVYINCPYISSQTRSVLTSKVQSLRKPDPQNESQRITNILCDFLLQNTANLLFYWGYFRFNTSKQLTFRTYQRTMFKQYKNKRSVELYGSLAT